MSRVFLIGAIVVVVAAALLLFWERNPAPQEELKLWRQKLDGVIQRTESETYAPDATAAARDSFAAIEHLVQDESGRLPLFRDYTRAREGLNRFGDTLAWLEAQAVQGKEAMRASVEAAIQKANESAAALAGELETAPGGKSAREALRQLHTGLREAREQIGRAQTALTEGRIAAAKQEVQQARTRLETLLQEVRTARERVRALRANADPG
jgi:chromosome segregation ATPase